MVVVLEKKSEEMNSVYTAKIDVIAIQLSTKKKFDYFLESVFEGTACNLENLVETAFYSVQYTTVGAPYFVYPYFVMFPLFCTIFLF